MTAIRTPADVDSTAIVLSMRERQGVTIAGGQGDLRGKIVRIGHIGYMDLFDVTTALAALETALVEAGADVVTAQHAMRHASPATLQRYVRPSMANVSAAMDRLPVLEVRGGGRG